MNTNNNNFNGLFPLLLQFNNGLYELFGHAPLYVGKFFIGVFYGLIVGFIFAFWKNEIIYNGILLSSSLWVLTMLHCITIQWKQIFFILGISGNDFSLIDIGNFITIYLFEIVVAILVTIVFCMTMAKYQNR